MKVCPVCSQTYTNEAQNFCLNDGAQLNQSNYNAPPTVFMDPPDATNQANWQATNPMSQWQDQSNLQNQPFMPMVVMGKNQTLPTVSLVCGILSILCCYFGFPFGIGALITGYLGLNNTNKDSMQYGGRGLAIAGLVLGTISLIGSVMFLLFAIIGNLH